ncbi:MAG: Ig-like domain-containing protein, partial [Candidatus Neomarinimicrobiota bacterium]
MKKLLIIFTTTLIWTCSSPTKSEPAPQPPTVNNLSITTNEDTPTTFTMTGSDPEGAALTFSISTQPQHGTVTASGAAGTYTPNENFNGTDTFAYIASDGALSSTAGLVSVTVTAVDDDPNTINVSAVTDEDNAVEITLEAEEYDGDTISFNIKDNPASGSVTLNGDKATYTPNENYYGSDSFTFEAVDYTAKKILNTATSSITINPINDAPVVDDITV